METLGQDRIRNLHINYRRNKIRIAVLGALTLLLLSGALFLAYRIYDIKTTVISENTPFITQAEADKIEAEARRDQTRARVDEAKDRNAALEAEIESLKSGN